jgi:hypothetical protein
MSSWKWIVISLFGGGFVFWIPDVVIPAFDHNEQGGLVTITCPAMLIVFYTLLLRLRRSESGGPSTAVFAICGMWLLSLWFTLLAQQVRADGGGRFTWGDFGYVLVSSFLPNRIVKFVTLEGSILALGIGTAVMIVCHLAFERSRWILPPGLWTSLRHVKP